MLFKPFNEWTHIVAVRPTGHVYSYEAVQQLCLKPKNMKDLLTETDFTKVGPPADRAFHRLAPRPLTPAP